MFVYGIHCSPQDIVTLPRDSKADYYMDYGVLVFPNYTRASCVNSYGNLSPKFWKYVKQIVENPNRVHISTTHDHPYITDQEYNIVLHLQDPYPDIKTNWYYVPRVNQELIQS